MSTKLAPALRPDWSRAPHRPGLSADGCRRTVDPPTMRFKRQLVAAGGNGLGLIEPFSRASDLRPVATGLQPRGSIKAPFFVVRQGDSGSGGEGAAHARVE